MKIGIITLTLTENYGGILQAYALQSILQQMGHDATIIDRSRYLHWSPFKKCRVYTRRFLKKLFIDKGTIVRPDLKNNRELEIIRANTYPFLLKHLHRIETDRHFSTIAPGDFDAFIVGSDQVWRPQYFGKPTIANAFLSFAEGWNVKRLSYAASFGTDEWLFTDSQTKKCGELLRQFNAVSVREESGVGLCKQHFNTQAQHLLDPTLLLTAAHYTRLFEEAGTPPSDGTLMCYILDPTPDKKQIVTNVAQAYSLKAFSTTSSFDHPELPLQERIQPPVENWLRGFYDAKFVITDSFHACIFSILFQKPFVVYGNKSRGIARFTSLLKTFGLENRLVTNSDDAKRVINEPIDWGRVNTIKKEWQEKSIHFLKSNLQQQ